MKLLVNKREVKKDEIIKVAFSEWGKNGFRDMSLTMISKKLDISKAALYRYFKNKDEIMHSLVDYFLIDYLKVSEEFVRQNNGDTKLEDIIFNYIKLNFTFFAKNPSHLFFFSSSMMMDNIFKNKNYLDYKTREGEIFLKSFAYSSSWFKEYNANHFMNHLFGTGIFLIFHIFYKKRNREHKPLSDNEISDLIELIYQICVYGFLSEKADIAVDYERIEKDAAITADEIPVRNKIFDAITSVVAEEGLWNASLDKIAKKAGMSKSSFYFHFANKEEMFGNMVVNEIQSLNELYEKKCKANMTFFEKLYSNIISESTYVLSDLRMMRFFNWLHFQKIDFKAEKRISKTLNDTLHRRFSFIEEALANNLLKRYDFNFEDFITYLNMQLIKEIMLSRFFNREITCDSFRVIYKLFLTGIYER